MRRRREQRRARPWTVAFLLAATAAFGPARAEDEAPPASPRPERICAGRSPWLSPDGRRIVVQRFELDLASRDADGQPRTVFLPWVRDLATGKEWRLPEDGNPDGWEGSDTLVMRDGRRVPLEGKAPPGRLPHVGDDVFVAALARSRDGRTVAFAPRANDGDAGLYLVRGDEPPRRVDLGREVNGFEGGTERGVKVAFSPDGQKLAFHLGFADPPARRVGVLDLASGRTAFVATEESAGIVGRWGWGRDPADDGVWDARGSRFAFLLGRGFGDADVYVASADGAEVHRLTADGKGKTSPVLSPEGDRVAFWVAQGVGWEEGLPIHYPKGVSLRVLQLRTGASVDLPVPTPEGEGSHLTWTVDGKRLLYAWEPREKGSEEGIHWVAAPAPAAVPPGTPIVESRRTVAQDVTDALRSPSRSQVEWALQKARSLDGPEIGPAIGEFVRRRVREGNGAGLTEAVHVLERTDGISAWPDLAEALSLGDDGVRSWAIGLLVDWGVDAVAPTLRHVAETTRSDSDRVWSLLGLARFGEATAWDRLAKARASGGKDGLQALVYGLRRVRDPRSVDLLIDLLTDDTPLWTDEPTRRVAARHLAEMTGQSLGNDPEAWKAWWKGHGRRLDDGETTGGNR